MKDLQNILKHYIELRESKIPETDGDAIDDLHADVVCAQKYIDLIGDDAGPTLNGQPVLQSDDGKTIWIPIPPMFAQPTGNNKCTCDYCTAHPDKPPRWDTICIAAKPGRNGQHVSTVHFPEVARKAAMHGWPVKALKAYPKYRTITHLISKTLGMASAPVHIRAGQYTIEERASASSEWQHLAGPFDKKEDATQHIERCIKLDNL